MFFIPCDSWMAFFFTRIIIIIIIIIFLLFYNYFSTTILSQSLNQVYWKNNRILSPLSQCRGGQNQGLRV